MTKGYSIQEHRFPEFFGSKVSQKKINEDQSFIRSSHFQNIDEIHFPAQQPKDDFEGWEEKIRLVRMEAYEQGFSQGRDEGVKLGKKNLEPVIQKFEAALIELENTKQRIYTDAEREAVDLSLAIAKKIVGNEIIKNKNIITHVVKAALARVEGHDQVTIMVNPSEVPVLNDACGELNDIVKCMDNVAIEGSDDISAGGCLIRTNIGDIDARIEKQFDIVEEAFNVDHGQQTRESEPE